MIIVNAYFSYHKQDEKQSPLDENGLPIEACIENEYSALLPCQKLEISKDRLTKAEGHSAYNHRRYDLLVDARYISDEHLMDFLRLYDKNKRLIAEIPIIAIEYIEAVRQYKISI